MAHKLTLERAELRDLALAALVLAFCFGFRWEGPKTFGAWFGNFVVVLGLVALSMAVHEFAHRALAAKKLAKVKSRLFLSGALAAIVLSFLTNGLFIFAAIWAISIKPIYLLRPGRPYPKWHLGPYERAQIAVAGPLANFGLAILAKLLTPLLGVLAEKLMIINLWIAALNLFPFFTLFPIIIWRMTPVISKQIAKGTPYIEGEFVFFGSRPLWIFTFVLVLVGGLGLLKLGALTSLLIGLIAAICLYLLWWYWLEMK